MFLENSTLYCVPGTKYKGLLRELNVFEPELPG